LLLVCVFEKLELSLHLLEIGSVGHPLVVILRRPRGFPVLSLLKKALYRPLKDSVDSELMPSAEVRLDLLCDPAEVFRDLLLTNAVVLDRLALVDHRRVAEIANLL